MKKIWDSFVNVLVYVWSILSALVITFGGIALLLWLIKSILNMVGVM